MILLSILICSLENRKHLFKELFNELRNQMVFFPSESIEILYSIDNGERTTGAKRDCLLRNAKGKYVIWCDDDDFVYPCYISELMKAAESDADCFATNGIYTRDGQGETKWKLSKDYPNTTVYENGQPVFLRTTNHITAVKREIALKAGFPDISNGEDKAYSEGILPHLKTEFLIHPPMYHYRFSSYNKTYK